MNRFANQTLLDNIEKVGGFYELSWARFQQLNVPDSIKSDPVAFAAFFTGVMEHLTND